MTSKEKVEILNRKGDYNSIYEGLERVERRLAYLAQYDAGLKELRDELYKILEKLDNKMDVLDDKLEE